MDTKHFNFLLTLICLCIFDHLNEVLAKKRACQDTDDDSLVVSVRCDEDSLEDASESRSLEDDKGIRRLKDQVKELQDDLRSLTEEKRELRDELADCRKKLIGTRSKHKKSKGFASCRPSSDGCDSDNTSDSVSEVIIYYDDDYQDNSDEVEKKEKSLTDRIRSLKKKKITLKKEINRLTRNLKNCQDKLTPTVPTPEPIKIKKFVIRTEKVSWYKAKDLCEREQKQLASITSQSDQDALAQTRQNQGVNSGQLWVAGYRDKSSGQFSWKGKGSVAFSYNNWHPTEPSKWSDEDQNCVESSWKENKYMWFVYECDTEYNYACEYY